MMQKLLRGKRDLPSPTSTGARWWLRALSSSAPPGMHFSGEQRQQQEDKKYSQVHYYLEELTVNKEKNNFSIFKLRFRLFFLHNDSGLYSHWRKPCLVPCMTSSYFLGQSLSYATKFWKFCIIRVTFLFWALAAARTKFPSQSVFYTQCAVRCALVNDD